MSLTVKELYILFHAAQPYLFSFPSGVLMPLRFYNLRHGPVCARVSVMTRHDGSPRGSLGESLQPLCQASRGSRYRRGDSLSRHRCQ